MEHRGQRAPRRVVRHRLERRGTRRRPDGSASTQSSHPDCCPGMAARRSSSAPAITNGEGHSASSFRKPAMSARSPSHRRARCRSVRRPRSGGEPSWKPIRVRSGKRDQRRPDLTGGPPAPPPRSDPPARSAHSACRATRSAVSLSLDTPRAYAGFPSAPASRAPPTPSAAPRRSGCRPWTSRSAAGPC